MKFISHRGNIRGRIPQSENMPDYVNEAILAGYDVEVDAWVVTPENKIFLGHDEPEFEVNLNFLKSRFDKLWIHCKNVKALHYFLEHEELNCFHCSSNEPVVLTSKKVMWMNVKQKLMKGSVCVLPEVGANGALQDCLGVCSDFIERFKVSYEKEVLNKSEATEGSPGPDLEAGGVPETEDRENKYVER